MLIFIMVIIKTVPAGDMMVFFPGPRIYPADVVEIGIVDFQVYPVTDAFMGAVVGSLADNEFVFIDAVRMEVPIAFDVLHLVLSAADQNLVSLFTNDAVFRTHRARSLLLWPGGAGRKV